jgi:hypothetical protein
MGGGRMRSQRIVLASSLVAMTMGWPATAAWADGSSGHGQGGTPTLSAPIATGLIGPLQLAVDDDTVYVAQDFAGVLTAIQDGQRTDLAVNPGGEIAGVDVGPRHSVLYTSSVGGPPVGGFTEGNLNRLRNDQSSVVADLLAYEQATNPDAGQHYGFEAISADCAAQWPSDVAGPPQYTGQIDAHPYAVASKGGTTYVADAGGNDILAVDGSGRIRTVAVLPAQTLTLSAAAAAANDLPACVAGLTYGFEAVPTDVEVGDDGMLYVTTLPGGPENPSLGARGSVYRINPRNGATRRLATGFAGAVNLALGERGEIFVSELFANRVSRVDHGGASPVISVNSPAALEYADGKLYVSYDSLPPENAAPDGKVAIIDLGRNHRP